MKAQDEFGALFKHLRERSTTGLSFSNIRAQLSTALQGAHPDAYCYIQEIHGTDEAGDVVYEMGSAFMRRKYKISTERGMRKTTMGEPTAVLPRTAWDEVEASEVTRSMESKEAGQVLTESLSGTVFPIVEAAVPRIAKLIAPGWGSSGYYPAEVLKRDGPKIFKSGTHMYMNHATRQEESERPEGDLSNLAGVLKGNAYWDESHKEGPGLYAPIDVFSSFAQHVAETAPYTGVSIRARGTGKDGKVGGRQGFIVDQLLAGESVDFVTRAGAGGKALTESGSLDAETKVKESEGMDKTEVQALIESAVKPIAEANTALMTENGTLKAQLLKVNQRNLAEDARRAAVSLCSVPELRLTEAVRERIVKRVMVLTIPTNEAGELKEADWKTLVEGEIKDEAAYLAKLTGGTIKGLGESAPVDPVEMKPEDAHKSMKESFIKQGYTPEQAETAAKGRVN